MEQARWDALIVGGGPAGLAAGMYLSRAGFRTLTLERDRPGGQARRLPHIENLPGFPDGVSGADLMDRYALHARRHGLVTRKADVLSLSKSTAGFAANTDGGAYKARAVILAPGTRFKTLGIPGEDARYGRGVYHAAWDAPARSRDGAVAVVGGGEAAVHQALALASCSRQAWLIYRGRLRAVKPLLVRLAREPRVSRLAGCSVRRIRGRSGALRIELFRERDGHRAWLPVAALFVLIGKEPDPRWRKLGNPRGLFRAGDLHCGRHRQVAVAAGDGIRAAMRCERFLRG